MSEKNNLKNYNYKILFIIDESGSVKYNLDLIDTVFNQIISRFENDDSLPKKISFECVPFGDSLISSPFLKTTFDFSLGDDKIRSQKQEIDASFVKRYGNPKGKKREQSNVIGALDYLINDDYDPRAEGIIEKTLLLLFTDGRFTDDLDELSQKEDRIQRKCKRSLTRFTTIAVPLTNSDIYKDEIRKIFSSISYYPIKNLDDCIIYDNFSDRIYKNLTAARWINRSKDNFEKAEQKEEVVESDAKNEESN